MKKPRYYLIIGWNVSAVSFVLLYLIGGAKFSGLAMTALLLFFLEGKDKDLGGKYLASSYLGAIFETSFYILYIFGMFVFMRELWLSGLQAPVPSWVYLFHVPLLTFNAITAYQRLKD
ncbi:MAG: hypothetical protein EOP06_02765 [Proteobacteria bacterium]|nr:MAG: hypothetical protein EOP06_02765 [Pseudomonadota bacterium]